MKKIAPDTYQLKSGYIKLYIGNLSVSIAEIGHGIKVIVYDSDGSAMKALYYQE